MIIEAVGVVGRIADAMLAAGRASVPGRPAADLRRAVGDLKADAEYLIVNGLVSAPMRECFDLIRLTDSSLADFAALRRVILAERPVWLHSIAVVQGALLFCLSQEARVIAAMEFWSRDQVEQLIVTMNSAFEVAELVASAQEDAGSYRRIISLHAAVTRHLSATARPLPQIVTYRRPDREPALKIAGRLYNDAARAGEIVFENHVVHPAFCPAEGRALTR